MCLAVPAKVRKIENGCAICSVEGGETTIQASLMLLDDEVCIDDYLLIHAGFALRRLDVEEARETLALMQEMAAHDRDTGGEGP
jgi:hydrogenase expression/formation protein HypC